MLKLKKKLESSIHVDKQFLTHLLYTGDLLTGNLANSVDQDEMQHNAAFHQGLHYLLRLKQSSGTDIHQNFKKKFNLRYL